MAHNRDQNATSVHSPLMCVALMFSCVVICHIKSSLRFYIGWKHVWLSTLN